MKKGLIIVAALAALAIPLSSSVMAQNQQQQQRKQRTQKAPVTTVHGTVTAADGTSITLDNKDKTTVQTNDKTQIYVDGKLAAADRKVEVGDKVTIKITDGIATQIDIRNPKPHKTDGANADQPKTGDQPKTETPK